MMKTGNQNRHTLRLHPWVIAWLGSYFVLVFGALIVIAFRRDDFSVLDRIFYSIAFSVGVIAIPSYGAWRITRSNKVGNCTCVVMVFLLYSCVGFGVSLAIKKKNRVEKLTAAYSELDSVFDEYSDDDLVTRMQNGENVSADAIRHINEFAAAADRVAAVGRKDEQGLVILATAMQTLELPLTAYLAAVDTYAEAGGADVTAISSLEDILLQVELIDEVIDRCRRFSDAYMQLEPIIRRELHAEGFPPDRIEYFISHWKPGARPDMAEKLRELEIISLQEDKRMLQFFTVRMGTWSIDDDGFIVFENEDDYGSFGILWQASDTAANNYAAYQKEMARTIQENQNP